MGNCQARAEKGELNFCDCIDENSKCSSGKTNQIDVSLPNILDCDKNGIHKWINKTLNCPTSDVKKKAALGLCGQDDNYNYVKDKCGFQNIEGFEHEYINSTANILKTHINNENRILQNNANRCKYHLNNKLNDYNNYLINAKSEYNSNENCNKYKIANKNCKTVEECEDITRTCKEKGECILREFKRATGYQNINNIENNIENTIENNIENNNLTYNIIYLLLIIFLLYICFLKKNIQTILKKKILSIIIIILIFISLYINIKYV